MKSAGLLQCVNLCGHTILLAPLGRTSTIVDLGANVGAFSRQLSRRFGCRCIAVEANPHLAEEVRKVPGVEVVWAAITGSEGHVELHLSEDIQASTILGEPSVKPKGEAVRVEGHTLPWLLRQHNITTIDLLKIDIEGAEIAALRATPDDILRRCTQISIEFHDFCGLTRPEEVREVCDRLQGLGFDAINFGNDNMNWLFVRKDAVGIGPLRRGYVKHGVSRARRLLHRLRDRVGARWARLPDE